MRGHGFGCIYSRQGRRPLNFYPRRGLFATPCGLTSTSMKAIGVHFNSANCWYCDLFRDDEAPVQPEAHHQDKFVHMVLDNVDHAALTEAIGSEENRKAIIELMKKYMKRNKDQCTDLADRANRNFPMLLPEVFKSVLPIKVSFNKIKGTTYRTAVYCKPGDYCPCVSCGDLYLNFETMDEHQRKVHDLGVPKIAKLTIPKSFELTVVPFGTPNYVNLMNHKIRRRILGVMGFEDVAYDNNRVRYPDTRTRDRASDYMQMDDEDGYSVVQYTGVLGVRPVGSHETGVDVTDEQVDSFAPVNAPRVYGRVNLPPPEPATATTASGGGPSGGDAGTRVTPPTDGRARSRTDS